MRQSTLALILLTVAVGSGLFLVKYRVQNLEDKLQTLTRDIADNRERIHVLRAEWSHFNEPDRLRVLAGRYLDMMPVQSGQVVVHGKMEENLPERVRFSPDQLVVKSADRAGKAFRP